MPQFAFLFAAIVVAAIVIGVLWAAAKAALHIKKRYDRSRAAACRRFDSHFSQKGL